jgi:hypothetical protein
MSEKQSEITAGVTVSVAPEERMAAQQIRSTGRVNTVAPLGRISNPIFAYLNRPLRIYNSGGEDL